MRHRMPSCFNWTLNIDPQIARQIRRIFTDDMMLDVNEKVQLDATVCRHLFTAESLYMFRVSQHPSSGVLKTVSATTGIDHDTGTAIFFQRGLVRTGVSESCGMYLLPLV